MSHQWALDLLTPDEYSSRKSVLGQIWTPLCTGLLAFGSVCFVKWNTKRPVLSGFQTHVIATAVATFVGYKWDEFLIRKQNHREAMLRHYIKLHPEDFPPPEKKKFGDVFEPWIPIR